METTMPPRTPADQAPQFGSATTSSGTADPGQVPVLWHLKVSNYNEKVRWALDYKQVRHIRRAVLPGRHRRIAKQLAGGSTFPVLIFEGHAIADSPEIIAALEERYPEPPLYPEGDEFRRRALELEEFFDEELGPYARLLFLHHVLPDADLTLGSFAPDLRGAPFQIARAAFPFLRRRVRRDFGIDRRGVEQAYAKLAAAGARFHNELQPSGYLVGKSFTVADLTLAALIAPLVAPQEFPYPQPQRRHPRLAPLREALAAEGLLYWARDMYRRHRGRSASVN